MSILGYTHGLSGKGEHLETGILSSRYMTAFRTLSLSHVSAVGHFVSLSFPFHYGLPPAGKNHGPFQLLSISSHSFQLSTRPYFDLLLVPNPKI